MVLLPVRRAYRRDPVFEEAREVEVLATGGDTAERVDALASPRDVGLVVGGVLPVRLDTEEEGGAPVSERGGICADGRDDQPSARWCLRECAEPAVELGRADVRA